MPFDELCRRVRIPVLPVSVEKDYKTAELHLFCDVWEDVTTVHPKSNDTQSIDGSCIPHDRGFQRSVEVHPGLSQAEQQ